MAFGITVASNEEFLPLFAWNAKGGAFSTIDKVPDGADYKKVEAELGDKGVKFLVDFETAKVGWLLFRKGSAPVKELVPMGRPMPPMPQGDYGTDDNGRPIRPRQGVMLRVIDQGGTLREFSLNSAAGLNALNTVHDAYLAAPESRQGMVPVVACNGRVKVDKNGNYAPTLAIEKWVPRPAKFGDADEEAAPVAPAPARKSPNDLNDAIPF